MNTNVKPILVVDDDPEIRELLTVFLEEKGFNVTTAPDGLQVMDRIHHDMPSIVIMDLVLPGKPGIPLVRSIKATYAIPLIIISGIYKREEIVDLIEECKVEGFLDKPIDLHRLMDIVNSIINA
ncbi:MAG: response regulator [Candidatus Omnitrophota bacterium]